MGLSALKYEDLPHYTYDDYVRWEGRWEVICGIPFAMTPSPAIKHQEISYNIAFQLDASLRRLKSKCKMIQAIDWQITDDTIVEPDVVVVCGDNPNKKRLLIPPVLVVEILSPSTYKKDRGIKYQLYQAAGVKYYCIIDPELESVEAYQLRVDEFEKKDDKEIARGITFNIDGCTIVLDAARIFNR